MRFLVNCIGLFSLLSIVAAIPVPAPAVDNSLSDAANALVNGIQANLNHGQQEEQTVQTLQSLEQNGAAAADIATGIANVKAALNLAIADRESNQALATPDFPNVLTGLAKVQAAQAKATTTVATLNGVSSNDAPILAGLLTTFEGGFATNQANLVLVSLDHLLVVENNLTVFFRLRHMYKY